MVVDKATTKNSVELVASLAPAKAEVWDVAKADQYMQIKDKKSKQFFTKPA